MDDLAPISNARPPYTPARNDLEQAVVAIWQDLLHVENVGVEDNFLFLGGESLLAMQAIACIHERFDVQISVRSVLIGTVAEVAAEIASGGSQ